MSSKENEESGIPKIVIELHIDGEYKNYQQEKEGNHYSLTREEFEELWWQKILSTEELEKASSSLTSEEIASEGLLSKNKKELDEYLQRKVRLSEIMLSRSMKVYETGKIYGEIGSMLAEEDRRRRHAASVNFQRQLNEKEQANKGRREARQNYSVGETIIIRTGEYAGYTGTVEDVDVGKRTMKVRPNPRDNDEWVDSIEVSSNKE